MDRYRSNDSKAWRTRLRLFTISMMILLGSVSAQAQQAGGDQAASLPNIVLVHGAWADGSSWSAVIERLQKTGYHVTAVQLPLTSMADDVAKTREVLAAQSGPTILVAHSYGGAVITALGADAPHVVGLVYIAAFAPDQGETNKGLATSEPQAPGVAAFRPDDQGFVWLDRDGFLQFFAPDVNRDQAQVMAAVQQPIAASNLLSEEPYGAPAWRSFPSWYLVAANDQIIHPDAERFMAQRMEATVETVTSSHVPMVSHPDVVANLIIKAGEETQILGVQR